MPHCRMQTHRIILYIDNLDDHVVALELWCTVPRTMHTYIFTWVYIPSHTQPPLFKIMYFLLGRTIVFSDILIANTPWIRHTISPIAMVVLNLSMQHKTYNFMGKISSVLQCSRHSNSVPVNIATMSKSALNSETIFHDNTIIAWNAVPQEIRQIPTLEELKMALTQRY